ARPLAQLVQDIAALSKEVGARARSNPDEVGAASVPYLRLLGHVCYAWLWARMAAIAQQQIDAGNDRDGFYKAKLDTAKFYYQRLLPETAWQLQVARSGAENLMEMDAAAF